MYWRLLRPNQWVKNGFVFAGILFGNGWQEWTWVWQACLTAVAFCLVSSSIYVFNDIVDRKADLIHPVKKNRPIAAGEVSVRQAIILCLGLGLSGEVLGLFITPLVAAMLSAYIVLNIAYTLLLKHKVIVDVFCISLGFMLRLYAGTVGLGILPSQWMLVCGMMVTLFLGFAKRRGEMQVLAEASGHYREVLSKYSPAFLDQMIVLTGTGTIITYSLYAMSDYVALVHGVENLLITVPLVAYGVMRYIFLVQNHSFGAHPTRELFRDRHILATGSAWFCLTLWLIY